MAEQHTDQQFLESIIKAIVENPNDVRSDQADMGQVIGRSGRTARAVRTLLRVVGAKNNARVNLKIYEPEGARRPMGGMRVGMMGSGMASPAPRASDENIDAGVDDLNL